MNVTTRSALSFCAVTAAIALTACSGDDADPVDNLRTVGSPGAAWTNDAEALSEAVGGEYIITSNNIAELDVGNSDEESTIRFAVPWSRSIKASEVKEVCSELALWVNVNESKLPGKIDNSLSAPRSVATMIKECTEAAQSAPSGQTSNNFLSSPNSQHDGYQYGIFAEMRTTDEARPRVTVAYAASQLP